MSGEASCSKEVSTGTDPIRKSISSGKPTAMKLGFLIKITINSFYCIHSVSFDFGKQVAERQFSIKLDGAKNFIQKQPK
jgi:hypothetical protein